LNAVPPWGGLGLKAGLPVPASGGEACFARRVRRDDRGPRGGQGGARDGDQLGITLGFPEQPDNFGRSGQRTVIIPEEIETGAA